jgi:hypothetical protein
LLIERALDAVVGRALPHIQGIKKFGVSACQFQNVTVVTPNLTSIDGFGVEHAPSSCSARLPALLLQT